MSKAIHAADSNLPNGRAWWPALCGLVAWEFAPKKVTCRACLRVAESRRKKEPKR